MILADTSVWIDHLRAGEPLLVELLDTNRVLVHPLIVGEFACSNLNNRKTVLSLLRKLPTVRPATDKEVLFFVKRRGSTGKSIGSIDAHLLAAVSLTRTARLWTRDQRLGAVVEPMRLAFNPA